MFDRRSDQVADAVRLLAAAGAVAADPSLMAGVKAAPGVYDALKRIAAAPPSGIGRMAETLAGEARALFAATRDLPPDAEALYAQMVEAGLVTPAEIVAAGMDASAATEAMLAKLTDPEHRAEPMRALFRRVTVPVMVRLLADKSFAADLTPAFMAGLLGEVAGLGAKLDRPDRLTRLEMEALANRFEIARIFGLSDAELREALEKKAEEYRDYRARIEAIDERMAGLGNLNAAVREAAERLDFDEVEALLARVDEVETEIAAETKLRRADNALLRGRVEDAYRLLSVAADGFASIDPVEPARRRLAHEDRLFAHGKRYGGPGLVLSERMIRDALERLSQDKAPLQWAEAQNSLAVNLSAQGDRVFQKDRVAGAKFFREALAACKSALLVCTKVDYPGYWAITQVQRGAALERLGQCIGGVAGANFLKLAVDTYRTAILAFFNLDQMSSWATAQNNLGNTLTVLGDWTQGPEGLDLLDEALQAYRAALTVRTETALPYDWAETMENVAWTYEAAARNWACPRPATPLMEAEAYLQAALAVYKANVSPFHHNKLCIALARVRGKLGRA